MNNIPSYTVVKNDAGDTTYVLSKTIRYYSVRYQRAVTVKSGACSDGATGAFDIKSASWWVHDALCEKCTWDNGEPLTNWQASSVLSDILRSEGRWFRAITWRWATWLFGCKGCHKNRNK